MLCCIGGWLRLENQTKVYNIGSEASRLCVSGPMVTGVKRWILAVADDDRPILQRRKFVKTSKKLRGESKLQREAVAKADQAE